MLFAPPRCLLGWVTTDQLDHDIITLGHGVLMEICDRVTPAGCQRTVQLCTWKHILYLCFPKELVHCVDQWMKNALEPQDQSYSSFIMLALGLSKLGILVFLFLILTN